MASIKNLTAVAATAAAFLTLAGAAGMPQASAETTPAGIDPALVMNGNYQFAIANESGYVWKERWSINTECKLRSCTQHIASDQSYSGTARLQNDKWTFATSGPNVYECKDASSTDLDFLPGTATFTYDAAGGSEVDVAAAGHACHDGNTSPIHFSFTLTKIS